MYGGGEADGSGKVSLVITNPSPEVVQLDTGQYLGSVCEWSHVVMPVSLQVLMCLMQILGSSGSLH